MIMRLLIFIALSIFFFGACKKVINVDLKNNEDLLVVDAFINSMDTNQHIVLTHGLQYTDDQNPYPINNATVKVINSEGDTFHFIENAATGVYIWNKGINDTICKVGLSYRLLIKYDGATYEAQSSVYSVPSIDSIKFEPQENLMVFGDANDYRDAHFYANDPYNENNYCWIKYYRNGVSCVDPNKIAVSVNGAEYPGNAGGLFLLPVRKSINYSLKPYMVGDTVKVELYSITRETWNFFSAVNKQNDNSQNSLGGLFAVPMVNAGTNIIRTSSQGLTPQGWFCTSFVSSKTKIVN